MAPDLHPFRFEVLTLFADYFESPLRSSILGRAVQRGLIDVHFHDIRLWTADRHRSVDDEPYGGGAGMVVRVEPVVRCIEAVRSGCGPCHVVWLTPAAPRLSQADVRRWAALPERSLALLCGHYEGIDERVEHFVDERASIGDFVLSGGEPAAAAIIDAVARLLPGVVGNAASIGEESFGAGGLLEYPQYTRPRVYRGHAVPDVLLGGHHARIAAWRKQQALERTRRWRPDLLRDELAGGWQEDGTPRRREAGTAEPKPGATQGRAAGGVD